ncbi:hypothetical protein BC941DRAFT_472096 [Chlamydoabsidia padenii]|nr:hypothetical protein BC941DRAFT_472096 [Chlamydoabsidia padenii]
MTKDQLHPPESKAPSKKASLSHGDDLRHLHLEISVEFIYYPHTLYMLPFETDDKQTLDLGPYQILDYLVCRWNNKLGIWQKVADILARKTKITEGVLQSVG